MKKLFSKVFISILSGGLLLFTSCNNDLQPNDLNLKDKTSQAYAYSSIENPYEYVGIEHNRFMEKFTQLLESSYNAGEWENIDFLSESYVANFSNIMNESYLSLYLESTSTVQYQIDIYHELNLNEWFNNNNNNELHI